VLQIELEIAHERNCRQQRQRQVVVVGDKTSDAVNPAAAAGQQGEQCARTKVFVNREDAGRGGKKWDAALFFKALRGAGAWDRANGKSLRIRRSGGVKGLEKMIFRPFQGA